MIEEPNAESLILSRFFHKNINTVKSKNDVENFDKSTNFCSIIMENRRIDKRKMGKRKIFGPQFKGFTNEDKNRLELEKDQIDQLVKKIDCEIEEENNGFKKEGDYTNECRIGPEKETYQEDHLTAQIINNNEDDFFGFSVEERVNANRYTTEKQITLTDLVTDIINTSEEGSDFLGFSQEEINQYRANPLVDDTIDNIAETCDFLGFYVEEIEHANSLTDQVRTKLSHLENNKTPCCPGFSEQEQHESISALSDILKTCVSIRDEIYKNIDRRILTYHCKEEKSRKKVVCSKYWMNREEWTVKEENYGRVKKDGIKSEISLCKKNHVKKKRVKTENSESKDGTAFFLEMQKIHQEVKTIRNNNNSQPTEYRKPEAPFFKVKKELIMSPFAPPKSPHQLIEEELYHDPWALLVATIFLNKTSGRSARPYVFWFLEENPDPLVVLGKRIEQLETYFGALGLQKTRANQVWRMSHDFIYKKWRKVSELYGIGRYGEEAFRMFCLGDFSFVPQDRYLRIYSAWYEIQEKDARLKEINS